jgi:hypothetical protein
MISVNVMSGIDAVPVMHTCKNVLFKLARPKACSK